jgi:putative MFS transporter
MTTELTAGGPDSAEAAQKAIIARLERLPISAWHVRARLIIGTATFFDAYALLSIAYALPVLVRSWQMSSQSVGLVISAGFFGQLVGALLFGWIAERFGRLRTITITIGIFAVMSVVCALAWDATSLSAFRFLQGIGVGGEVPVASAYINEFAAARRRGRFFVLYEIVFPIGLLFASAIGYWLVPIYGWPVVFYVGAIPAFLALSLRWLLPESPRWLASKGRIGEAEAVVAEIEQTIERSGIHLPPPAATSFAAPVSQAKLSPWREIVSGIYLRRSLVVWTLWVCTYLVYYGLTTWLPTIYTSVFHVPLSTALGFGLLMQAIGLFGSLACAYLIDWTGRRRWYIMSFFCGAIPLVVLWFIGATSAFEVFVCATIGGLFLGTINLSLYLYTAELYPTRIRAFASSIASAWLRLASAIAPAAVGFLIGDYGIGMVFIAFAAVAAIGGFTVLCFSIETTGQVLEDISP